MMLMRSTLMINDRDDSAYVTNESSQSPTTVADYERIWSERQKTLGQATQDLMNQRSVLISYLNVKVHTDDWHGVMDAACDLRDIDSELRGMRR